MIFAALMDDEVIELSHEMLRHLPARVHVNCKTVESAAYAMAGRVDEQTIAAAVVALETGRWPGDGIYEERLPTYYPDLPKIAQRLNLSVGEVYQAALSRACWYLIKPPRMVAAVEAERILGVTRNTIYRWVRKGLFPEPWSKIHRLWPEPILQGYMEFAAASKKGNPIPARLLKSLEDVVAVARRQKYRRSKEG